MVQLNLSSYTTGSVSSYEKFCESACENKVLEHSQGSL